MTRGCRRFLAPGWHAALVLGCALACACTAVKPYERQQLSKPEMQPASDVEEDIFHSHIDAARRGAMGGHGGAGGGCGCG